MVCESASHFLKWKTYMQSLVISDQYEISVKVVKGIYVLLTGLIVARLCTFKTLTLSERPAGYPVFPICQYFWTRFTFFKGPTDSVGSKMNLKQQL